jgi:hypothetical protein
LCFLIKPLVPLKETDTPPESNNIEIRLKEEGPYSLVIRKSAPKFFRVFAISAKLTDFRPEKEVLKVKY